MNSLVKKQLAHILFEVMQNAQRDPEDYRPYFSDVEIERIRDVCKGRWYHMTCDAVCEAYFKVSFNNPVYLVIGCLKCLCCADKPGLSPFSPRSF